MTGQRPGRKLSRMALQLKVWGRLALSGKVSQGHDTSGRLKMRENDNGHRRYRKRGDEHLLIALASGCSIRQAARKAKLSRDRMERPSLGWRNGRSSRRLRSCQWSLGYR